MIRKKQEQIKFWFPYIEELEKNGVVYDLKNLLQMHGRCLVGFTRQEMVDKAKTALEELNKDGYINITKTYNDESKDGGALFNNIEFEYTKKFEKYKIKKSKKVNLNNLKMIVNIG